MPASILIADDDPNIVRALAFLMQREGHSVRAVADGEEALAAIAETAPKLLLLDVMMPKRNGYDVCRVLRADRAYDDLRIVMLTAKGREDERRVGLDLGVDAYITKPFAIADVVDRVASVLARPRGAAPAGAGRPSARPDGDSGAAAMPQAIKRRDRLIGLFVAGAVLLDPPMMTLFSGGTVFGWPALYLYLFGVWAALIAGLAFVLESRAEAPRDPDDGGGLP